MAEVCAESPARVEIGESRVHWVSQGSLAAAKYFLAANLAVELRQEVPEQRSAFAVPY
jgi:hypothetical protein